MDSVSVDDWGVLAITWFVADFLRNTHRYLSAIEFYKELLSLVNDKKNLPSASKDSMGTKLQIALYNRLASAYLRVGNFFDSKTNAELAVRISNEVGEKKRERESYCNLCAVFEAVCRYDEMIKYGEKVLQISKELEDAKVEAKTYWNLGRLHYALGQYDIAREYYLKSADRSKEVGLNRRTERLALTSLGDVLCVLKKPREGLQKLEEALKMSEEVEDRYEQAPILNLAGKVCYYNLFRYDKAIEYLKRSIQVSKEVNDSITEGEAYFVLGDLLSTRQQYDEAIKYLKRAIEIVRLTGEKYPLEGACIALVRIYLALGKHDKAMEYKRQVLESVREAGTRIHNRSSALLHLGYALLPAGGDRQEICDIFSESIRYYEKERQPLNEEHKLSLGDKNQNFYGYKYLGSILIILRRNHDALCSLEQGRARVLTEILAKRYSIQDNAQFRKDSLCRLMGHLRKEQILVFIASLGNLLFSFVMINEEEVKVFTKEVSSTIDVQGLMTTILEENFRSLVRGQEIQCEDRSLSAFYDSESAANKKQNAESDDKGDKVKNAPNELYNLLVAPFADRIEGREVVLVPEGFMFLVPYSAVQDNEGKYLSEKCRICIMPSLASLELILDSPADYHSQTGALIVGDPDVSQVRGLGQLPAARQEAREIAELLDVSPLLGEQATKEEVMRKITDVCLIHIAAHGDAERGEIACTPNPSSSQVPRKEDFMLTVEDIAKVGLRAKLVVLSCCHSGRGKIMKSEGVVGIARAFIASGARSVLVSLWLLNDKSTKAFMIRFYGHLVRDKLSASKALHQSMKWMRKSKKYSVSDWAPFVLIGDDVTLDL